MPKINSKNKINIFLFHPKQTIFIVPEDSYFSFPNVDFDIAKYFCTVETPGSALTLNWYEYLLPKRVNKMN